MCFGVFTETSHFGGPALTLGSSGTVTISFLHTDGIFWVFFRNRNSVRRRKICKKKKKKDLWGRVCRKWTHVLNTVQGNGVRVICAKIPPQDVASPNVFNAESSFFFSFFLFFLKPALLCHIHLCFLPLIIHFLSLISRIQLFHKWRPPQTKWLILSRNAFRVNRKLQ